MEVEVVDGEWDDGSILRVQIGKTAVHSMLRLGTKLFLPSSEAEHEQIQVDMFRNVGSATAAANSATTSIRVISDGRVAVLLKAVPSIRPDTNTESAQKSDNPPERQKNAAEYIDRFGLRKFLQQMFQAVARDQPDNPFAFMHRYLTQIVSGGTSEEPAKRDGAGCYRGVGIESAGGDSAAGDSAAGGSAAGGSAAGCSAAGGSATGGTNPDQKVHRSRNSTPPLQDASVIRQNQCSPPADVAAGVSRDDETHSLTQISDPEVLVDVHGCQDTPSNGVFARMGERGGQALYRRLGPEPRYLLYANVDNRRCWCLVDGLQPSSVIDRFTSPPGTASPSTPVQCGRGENGTTARAGTLTCEAVCKISLVSSPEEKAAIRGMLDSAFGLAFRRLEGAGQSSLVSVGSPVIGVARAFEAQQQAILRLQKQLAAETSRRCSSELRAKELEASLEAIRAQPKTVDPSGPREPEQHAADQETGMSPSTSTASIWPGAGGPLPRPPVSKKETRPVPPPKFGRLPSCLRNRLCASPTPDGAPEKGASLHGNVNAAAAH